MTRTAAARGAGDDLIHDGGAKPSPRAGSLRLRGLMAVAPLDEAPRSRFR